MSETFDPRPTAVRLADFLMARIESGAYPAGEFMPTVRDLAAEFDVAPSTAMRALHILRDQDWIATETSRGSVVR